eukprot:gene9046-16690_t
MFGSWTGQGIGGYRGGDLVRQSNEQGIREEAEGRGLWNGEGMEQGDFGMVQACQNVGTESDSE